MSKLAVITGADGGMGKEITRAVAEAGYHVIMLCYTLFKGEERKNQMILVETIPGSAALTVIPLSFTLSDSSRVNSHKANLVLL